MVSFLFSLLLKAVRRLSHFETANRAGLLTTVKDQVCGLLEQVVDKWFIERLFLNDGWLSDIGRDECSVQQRKKRRRKSRESSRVETSVDSLCSSQMGELLHVAMESCSQFRTSPVVKLALTRLFNGSKMLLVGAQRDGALGRCVCVCVCVVQCMCVRNVCMCCGIVSKIICIDVAHDDDP